MFRGFIQGILEKNYVLNRKKLYIKIIIVITSLLFTTSHVRYIIYGEVGQWILSFFALFAIGLYLGYLRNKYQSIWSVWAKFTIEMTKKKMPIPKLPFFRRIKVFIFTSYLSNTILYCRKCCNIVVLEKGRVVEQGTHKELTALRGVYYELVKNQLELGN